MTKIFIDGSAGTTGLRIRERLSLRKDITLINLKEEFRKDINARKDALNSSDIAFLCLPDIASIEAVSLVENPNTAIIDTSTAHRVNDNWTYGFSELKGQKEKISSSKKIANPGCHASGFISLIRPLTDCGLIEKDALLTCFSLTGYTGGGKKMIAEYEENKPVLFEAPRQYGLTQNHKHLPEMTKLTGIEKLPVFCPIVSDFACGMEVTVPLFREYVKGGIEDIKTCYRDYYKGKIVRYAESDENGFLSAGKMAGFDDMEISVYGNDERITVVSRFDNLGKGASGSALQNMNILMGIPEETGLNIKGI